MVNEFFTDSVFAGVTLSLLAYMVGMQLKKLMWIMKSIMREQNI